jgi:H/ACA ribonucleoprotein complex subunit 4
MDDEEKIREVILPLERAVETVGKIVISDTAIWNICNGAPLAIPGIVRLEDSIKKGDMVAIFSLKGELVALGKAVMSSEEIYKKRRGIAVKTDRVIMKKGVYPRK